MDTKASGNITEGRVLAALLQAGKVVLLPFGENLRYDLVIEDGGQFFKVQCKTGRLRGGSIKVNASSVAAPHRGGQRRDYRGQADYFGVYCPDTDETYLIPVNDVPTNEFRLRVTSALNGQSKNVRLAADYKIARK